MEPSKERKEMEEETVKNMDVDLSKRFFKRICRNDEITNLNIPHTNMFVLSFSLFFS